MRVLIVWNDERVCGKCRTKTNGRKIFSARLRKFHIHYSRPLPPQIQFGAEDTRLFAARYRTNGRCLCWARYVTPELKVQATIALGTGYWPRVNHEVLGIAMTVTAVKIALDRFRALEGNRGQRFSRPKQSARNQRASVA